eukprot:4043899-Prymnesium_polylepis.1
MPVTPDASPSMQSTWVLLQCLTFGRESTCCACVSSTLGSLGVIQCNVDANLELALALEGRRPAHRTGGEHERTRVEGGIRRVDALSLAVHIDEEYLRLSEVGAILDGLVAHHVEQLMALGLVNATAGSTASQGTGGATGTRQQATQEASWRLKSGRSQAQERRCNRTDSSQCAT